MNPEPRAGRRLRPPALSVALAVATLVPGCMTQSISRRDEGGPARAANLLTVSAIAPAINARTDAPKGQAGPPGPGQPDGDSAATAAGSKPEGDASLRPASADPLAPPPGGQEAPQVPAPATAPPGGPAPGPLDDPGSGLMGPTPPTSSTAAATPPSIPESAAPYPIDLPSALRLADDRNPVIGEARILILGALAERQSARALLLPYLNAGANYHDHTGPLQRSNGTILKLTEQSFYFGGGARTVGAETVAIPAVNIFSPLTDAIYEPLAAQQRVTGARFNASATANSVLLEVASLYIDLIGADAILQARRELAGDADRIAASVQAYAATGQGRRSDADRADADRRLFQLDIQKAEERVAVASALLAQRLNLDPSARLQPLAGPLEPISLIDPATPAEELVRSAIARRPDLAARDALIALAEYRVQQEKARPFLPTIWLGFSGGAFGGGSNLVPPGLSRFAGRTDFDVRAYWTVLNMGAGNASLIKQRKAQAGQAAAERARVLNDVRREVASARAESLARRNAVVVARRGVATAEQGFANDQARLRATLALPIEALDSLRLLADSRVQLVEAITRANRTQMALFVALGAPPPLEPLPGSPAAPPVADAAPPAPDAPQPGAAGGL